MTKFVLIFQIIFFSSFSQAEIVIGQPVFYRNVAKVVHHIHQSGISVLYPLAQKFRDVFTHKPVPKVSNLFEREKSLDTIWREHQEEKRLLRKQLLKTGAPTLRSSEGSSLEDTLIKLDELSTEAPESNLESGSSNCLNLDLQPGSLNQPGVSSSQFVPGMLMLPGATSSGAGQGSPQPQAQAVPAGLRQELPDAWIPWGIGPDVFGRLQTVPNASYRRTQILPTDPEWRFVWRYFYHDKPTRYGIGRVYCVHERSQTGRFESNLATLERDATQFPPTWDQEPRADQRAEAITRFRETTAPFSPFQTMESDGRRRTWNQVRVLPMWHGSDASRCHSVADGGFTFFGKTAISGTATGSTDDGYFGSGIYFTNSARYAADIYSHGHLLLSWVSMTEPFPVVGDPNQEDMRVLRAKGAYKHYNAHYIPVVPAQPSFTCVDYFPCQTGQSPTCDELVVFQRAQTLPRYWLELQVEHPGMLTPSGVPAFVEDLVPYLIRVLENPEVDADKKLRNILSRALAKLFALSVDEDLDPEDLALFVNLGQLFDSNGRVVKAVRNAVTGGAVQSVPTPVPAQAVLAATPVPVVVVAPPAPVIQLPVVPAQQAARTVVVNGVLPHQQLGAQNVGALEWELSRKGSKGMTYAEAQAYAASRAGQGWRLPTIWELYALYQQKSVLGADLDEGWFWSDTAVAGNSLNRWVVRFSDGGVGSNFDLVSYQVRLVRG